MKRRIFVSMLIILVALAASLGATMAWFTDSPDPLTNYFTAGTLEIDADDYWKDVSTADWENVNPGDCRDKVFEIVNKGTKHSLIRFQFTGEWGSLEDDLWVTMPGQDPTLVTVSAPDGWFFYDGWWYYDGILTPEMDPNNPFTFDLEVCVKGKETGNEYQGMSYKLVFTFEAIQASNNASGEAWGVDSWYFDDDEPPAAAAPDPVLNPDLDLSADNWASFDPAKSTQ